MVKVYEQTRSSDLIESISIREICIRSTPSAHTIPYPTAGPLSAPARPSRRHVADRLVADHSRVPRSRNCPARVIFPGCVEVWTGETQPPYYPPLASPQPAPTPHAPHDRYVVVRPSVRRNRLQTPEAAEAGSKQWRVDSWHSPPARRPRCTGGRCCVCVRWYSSRRLGRRWHPVRSVHAQSRARASAGFPARLLHAQRRPCLVPGPDRTYALCHPSRPSIVALSAREGREGGLGLDVVSVRCGRWLFACFPISLSPSADRARVSTAGGQP